MTAILFWDSAPDAAQAALLDQLGKLDERFISLPMQRTGSTGDADGEIARLFGAAPGTLYLLRPDLHIAGRWKRVAPDEVLRTAAVCLGRPLP